MAVKSVRVCDVFNTSKDIETYLVEVSTTCLDEAGSEQPKTVKVRRIDLSPRGLARLKRFIERGLTSPGGPDDAK